MTAQRQRRILGGVAERAFSLVELLAAVAVVLVLLGLLLVATASVRGMARRAQCAAVLRQQLVALAAYAQQHEDCIPLVWETCKQANYIYYDNVGVARGWGMLNDAGLIDSARAAACPVQANPAHVFDAPNNRWPHQAGQITRSSYSLRPARGYAGTAPSLPPFPLLSAHAARAVAADLVSNPDALATAHGGGINVGFGDGHVAWAPRPGLAAAFLAMPANAGWSATYDAAEDALWSGLDAGP